MLDSEENRNLAARFHEYFSVGLANSSEDKNKVYKIRYRVYCDEFNFLPPSNYPNELESDEFDEESPNCLINHRSGNAAACVRLVFASKDGQRRPMPYELLGENMVSDDMLDAYGATKDNLVEISRLAVDGAFRRRSGEARTRFGEIDSLDIEQVERRTFGLISVAAFFSAAAMAERFNKTVGVAMMESFLPRLMSRAGIVFEQAGPEIEYHGKRAPYVIKLESMIQSMKPDLREFYKSIRASLK